MQSLDRLGRRGGGGRGGGGGEIENVHEDSAEILFKSFLREAIVNDSGMGRGISTL